MNENIEAVRTVVDWEVTEYHDTVLVLKGYNEDGEAVVERSYGLDKEGTRVKNEDGEWVSMNDIDDGGFPPEAQFAAFKGEK